MLIDCDSCEVRGAACGGCVVSVLLAGPSGRAELDGEERRAIDVLASSGLVPPLRLVAPRPGAAACGPGDLPDRGAGVAGEREDPTQRGGPGHPSRPPLRRSG